MRLRRGSAPSVQPPVGGGDDRLTVHRAVVVGGRQGTLRSSALTPAHHHREVSRSSRGAAARRWKPLVCQPSAGVGWPCGHLYCHRSATSL